MHRLLAGSGAALTAVLLLGGCSGPVESGPSSSSDTTSPVPGATETTPTAPPMPPPKRVACPRLGVYTDWDPDLDVDVVRQFGALPQVASSYYQPTESIRLPEESERIRRGTSPNITITTKGTNMIEVLAKGPRHPEFPEVRAWLERHLDDLSTLADLDPSVPVYATIDHEFRVKARTGQVTGRSADPVVYGRALDRFFELAHAENPRLRTTYWIVGYDREFEALVGEQFTTLPQVIVFDPYPDEATETLTSITTEDLAWIRSQPWYDGQEIGIGEFGMPASVGDEAMARFYTDLTKQLRALGVSWAVLFHREKDFDTRIVERSDGMRFPKARAAFAASLQAAQDCRK